MRLLAINASYRGDQGHTRFLIDRLFRGAAAAGAEFEVVTLAKFKINHCLACDRCHTAEHYLKCVYADKDDAAGIFAKMAAADRVIYATPVYLFGVSGLLKTFLDRLYGTSDVNQMRVTRSGLFFHHVDEAVCSKPFVSLIVCDNLDPEMPKNGRAYFRTFGRFMDAPHVGELIRSGGRLFGYGRDPQAAERFPKIRAVYAAYEQAGRELALNGRISRVTQRRASQEIIPVPFFGLLKHLTPFKHKMKQKAQEYFA
ncbi:MAG TPA: flavodoxin family protein [Anaerolineae bacterium]|nr:flavodoxin family protein [Anaerolineae bacterium]HQI87301.1 flavodoxin family protein [Anaerolineae bacterium]